ncbi:hypothetical protein Pla123a_49140 [Posidoniimonas polymericola]|uniref:Glycosyl transferases group 1 n=1 Tax=Posidoniimonas polymericola TaxID=2528002 RepID=A0A5C5XQE8_9BACT|nr:glycosyltransferase family 4 protein [Posidoniimonas polymericola]TWT65446.1 hypothetical protein Pla123a_49140 [Posidoniimonas polymericola]
MKLAILHYHLNRGGVSQAILNHLHALATLPDGQRPDEVALLYSGRKEDWPSSVWKRSEWEGEPPFPVRLLAAQELEYDDAIHCDGPGLADAVDGVLRGVGFTPDDTLLHSHNFALGKNASLPDALRLLAQRGYRQLLQLHDFAEDFRPSNYRHLMRATGSQSPAELAERLYPSASGMHYATLNGRDHKILLGAGVDPERLHLLSNPVIEFHGLPPRDEARPRVCRQLGISEDTRLVVYPVRGIRRKNVGELLLYSALAGPGVCHALTLAPVNPAERISYDDWCELAEELQLPCLLGIGDPLSRQGRDVEFYDALAASDAIITTSVAEGFGMVFLEAWLVDRPLIGRNLGRITSDFTEHGLRLGGLTDRLLVPGGWIDLDAAREEVLDLHSWACRDFGAPVPENPTEGWTYGPDVDFAALPRRFQADVIRHVTANPESARQEMEQLNPGLADRLSGVAAEGQPVAENAACVRKQFSPAAVGRRLSEIYTAIWADAPDNKTGGDRIDSLPDGEHILRSFLRLDRLFPVRLEP